MPRTRTFLKYCIELLPEGWYLKKPEEDPVQTAKGPLQGFASEAFIMAVPNGGRGGWNIKVIRNTGPSRSATTDRCTASRANAENVVEDLVEVFGGLRSAPILRAEINSGILNAETPRGAYNILRRVPDGTVLKAQDLVGLTYEEALRLLSPTA